MNYPEGLMYNPVGRFGLVYETEEVEYYIEHRSSIPEKHDGRGLNFIGLDIKTPKWKEHWNAFLGLSYHNAEFDCKTYCKDLDEVNLRYGVRYKQIFVEGLNDDKFSLGVEWRF